jgi:phosphoserine aminotransferase
MRIHNFNAGPAALPTEVLERAQAELLDYRQSGMSIMEHSHRGKDYDEVHQGALCLLRELAVVPDTHEVILMQGGGHMQFALVPMHFLAAGKSADYVITGGWSEKAMEEARAIGTVREAGSSKEGKHFVRLPSALRIDAGAAYVHTTSNNTLEGTQWHTLPETGAVPHVCDMSSDFLWRPLDFSNFALVYAAAQKNIGPSGLTVVVARKDFIAGAGAHLPPSLRYATYANAKSLYNTPPTFAIYIMRLVLEWTKKNGGLAGMEARNRKKAAAVYGAIDEVPAFYRCPVEPSARSLMNVVFRLPTEALEEKFISEGKAAGFVGMKGHRSVGGMRVSLYNPVEPASAEVLAAFMRAFAKENG